MAIQLSGFKSRWLCHPLSNWIANVVAQSANLGALSQKVRSALQKLIVPDHPARCTYLGKDFSDFWKISGRLIHGLPSRS
jgi:hypothetical protein